MAAGVKRIRMHKFAVYETSGRYYIFGSDVEDAHYRVLKIDRTAPPGQLNVTEDGIVYSRKEADELLQTIDDGNRNAGGMRLKTNSWGLLGFIRFTDAYYMLLITKKQQVAMIGGRYIYQVDGTELIPLTAGSSTRFSNSKNPEEVRFLNILNNLDLHRSFYFSYSYNVTRTLQHQIIRYREALHDDSSPMQAQDFNDMFVWNQHLLDPALDALKNPYDWCIPIIHGFVDQAAVNVFGRNVYITLIARRSRFFAGARFLKRGANDLGYVANDVETEQIVGDMMVTSFNITKFNPLNNPNYTSFVQHRGSIPLYWTQDNTGVSPKPAIDLNLIDPFYATASRHFDNLFQRYRAPICVLNLVKARERTPRESKLLVEYKNAIDYLNQMLPSDKKIIYRAYDMSRALKTRGTDVIGTLEEIAEELIAATGFFHNGLTSEFGDTSVQNGVIRSNCIDCLDRTNAAQFVVGKRALALQLQALGIIPDASINYDSDASNLFAHMFNDHGDTLASQYGGSHLVNTTDSYRKINNWQSHSRDMLESFKRYYHNSFLDNQRQEAYNLFLGNYIYAQGQPMLWDLPNDFYLHHTSPSSRVARPHYIKWYTPDHLKPQTLPTIPHPDRQPSFFEIRDWWDEYYRPPIISSFLRIFAYRMNSTTRYLPKPPLPRRYDMSPFAVRKHLMTAQSSSPQPEDDEKSDSQDRITDSNSINPLAVTSPPRATSKRIVSLQNWLYHPTSPSQPKAEPSPAELSEKPNLPSQPRQTKKSITSSTPAFQPADKTQQHQWTLGQFHSNSLHPSITTAEAADYERYISHPSRLLLQPAISASSQTESSPPSQRQLPNATYAEMTAYVRSSSLVPLHPDLSTSTLNQLGNSKATHNAIHHDAMLAEDEEEDSRTRTEFSAWLHGAGDAPLSVAEQDGARKRYRAYRKWVHGKSFFKLSKVDPEFA